MFKSLKSKIIAGLVVTSGIAVATPFVFYLKVLPYAVSNPKVIRYVENFSKKSFGVDLTVENPVMVTELSPNIRFSVKNITLKKRGKLLLSLKNFDSAYSFEEILKKNFIITKLVADGIFVDVNRLMEIFPQGQKKEQKQSEWSVEAFDSLLGVKNCEILYITPQNVHLHVLGKNISVNNAEKVKRHLYFDVTANIERAGRDVVLKFADNDKVFIEKKRLVVAGSPLKINKSNLFINFDINKKHNFNLELFSKNFNIQDIVDLVETKIIENNIDEILAYFDDLRGSFDFGFKMNNNDPKNPLMKGFLNLDKMSFKIVPVDNIPITLTKGKINFDDKNLTVEGFEGFYDNRISNKIDFSGDVKDYLKTIDMNIVGNAVTTNDFFKLHLTKMIGIPVTLTGTADTRVNIQSKNNIFDVDGLFKLEKGTNIFVDDQALPFENSTRVMVADMHFEDMIFDLKSLKYYLDVPKNKLKTTTTKGQPRPEIDPNDTSIVHRLIFSLDSRVNVAKNNFVEFIGFEIPDPLPSEIINVIAKQHLLKKGTIAGKIKLYYTGKNPYLAGKMTLDKVRIPAQRTYIKHAELLADGNNIHLAADGRFKKSKYDFDADLVNEIRLPVVVKKSSVAVDYIDIEKFLLTSTGTPQETKSVDEVTAEVPDSDDMGEGSVAYGVGSIVIEDCDLKLDKGVYKDINFGNLKADLTLDKDGVLNIQSNKFDFAEGISTLKVNCDLKKYLYYVRLGVKDIDSTIIAKSLLNLEKEISGKAMGLIELNTDKTLKMNGQIRFAIENGTIQKIGLVEYVMKVASLFRNPLAMISPSTFSDLVNVPEGNFDKINGTLLIKDNVIKSISIKSASPQLSAYIAGRYDLERHDTSLRIYTKFSSRKKGVAGFLRNISLNALANRIPMSSKNDAKYYASELKELPDIDADEKDCQIFITKVEGDVEHNNFLSSLKKLR